MKIQVKFAVLLMFAIALAFTACGGGTGEDPSLSPSTIVFADGATVSKIMGNPVYTNTITGDGTGAITYNSETPGTATVNASTGEVTLIAAGITVITAVKAATATYETVTNTYTLTVLGIGSAYQGGKIAYILQSGDPGYDAAVPHGLIAATADQSTGIIWALAAYQSTEVTGTLTTLGSGSANTDKIIAQNGAETTYAAGLARTYDGGSYTDWYLPSKDELNKLNLNKVAVGGFSDNYYWGSSEDNANFAWLQNFGSDIQGVSNKPSTAYVRAVRSF